jgi:nitrile hydratase accessory protein
MPHGSCHINRPDPCPAFRATPTDRRFAPWEAEAFAIVVALRQRGLFGWDEWAAMLGEEIKAAQRAGDPDTGETSYHHWLAALERMIAHKGIADRAALKRYHNAWERAADRTPHGTPIELTARDFAAE